MLLTGRSERPDQFPDRLLHWLHWFPDNRSSWWHKRFHIVKLFLSWMSFRCNNIHIWAFILLYSGSTFPSPWLFCFSLVGWILRASVCPSCAAPVNNIHIMYVPTLVWQQCFFFFLKQQSETSIDHRQTRASLQVHALLSPVNHYIRASSTKPGLHVSSSRMSVL